MLLSYKVANDLLFQRIERKMVIANVSKTAIGMVVRAFMKEKSKNGATE